jgi:hypothetical protein
MKKLVLLIVFLALVLQSVSAQNLGNQKVVQKDTPSVSSRKLAAEDSFPNPRKAFLWSIIPGGGQIYNKKYAWIKVPIVYAGLATGIYFIKTNDDAYRAFSQAYSEKINNLPFSDPTIPKTVQADRLKQIRDGSFQNLQQAYILTIVGYLLAGVEAFTAAHLAHFDVKDDLSMHLKPSFEPVPLQGSAVGMGIQIKF